MVIRQPWSIHRVDLQVFPKSLDGDAPDYLMEHYDVLAGKYPEKWNELVLV